MSKFRTEFYCDANTYMCGIQFELVWRNEAEHELAQSFLRELFGDPCGVADPARGKPEFYLIETEEQFEALFDFQRKLRERR